MHTCIVATFNLTSATNQHFLALKYSQNLFIKVMRSPLLRNTKSRCFFQYHEGLNFVTGEPPSEIEDVHTTVPNKASPITTETKANDDYVIPQESPVLC